ncbi:hypothetical protein HZA45_03730 [Candidatus Peregrinibacteria bacterium]|nr:hypothetical protein [Candidatus Peregrinibacteria bacterium]
MTPIEDTLSSFGIKMAIDSLTSEIRQHRTLADLAKPDAFMKAAEESHGLIRENFKEWRDYLYKYILMMTTVTGFFTTLMSAKWTRVVPDPVTVYWAFGLMGGSIFVGMIAIFVTIFIERQIIDSHVLFALPTSKDRDPDINPIDAHKMGSRESIAENEAKLEVETDEKQRAILKMRIKADKRHLRLMYFVAAPVTWYEYVRLGTTALMVILSLTGIGILMNELLSHAVAEPTTPIIQAPQGT